jgi:3',5'-cyclic AMP phosphodiesterase CpdA
MTVPTDPRLSRRAALKATAGALLTWGLWPGALRADNRAPAGSFRFVVVNDTHHQSPECSRWLEGVVRRMKADRPAFCLLAGDLAEQGAQSDLEAVRRVFRDLRAPVYPVIGNHDYRAQTDRAAYEKVFPKRLNYSFRHGGWQFVGLDTSEGTRYEKTRVSPETFAWLDKNLKRLDPRRPTVLFTHFPLGDGVKYRPLNADELLERFREFNLQAAFSGHFHGFTERQAGGATLTTNRCCALKRGNHDGTKEKGWFVCEARAGRLTRRFVEYQGA